MKLNLDSRHAIFSHGLWFMCMPGQDEGKFTSLEFDRWSNVKYEAIKWK